MLYDLVGCGEFGERDVLKLFAVIEGIEKDVLLDELKWVVVADYVAFDLLCD